MHRYNNGSLDPKTMIIVETAFDEAWITLSVLHCVCNQFADALANDWIIEHRIELVWRKGLLRVQERIAGRTIPVRLPG